MDKPGKPPKFSEKGFHPHNGKQCKEHWPVGAGNAHAGLNMEQHVSRLGGNGHVSCHTFFKGGRNNPGY